MNELLSSGCITPRHAYPSKRKEIPSIEYVQYEAGQRKQDTLLLTHIILVTEGTFLLSYDHFLDHKLRPGKILLLPPGCHFTVRAENYASALVFRFKEAIRFCEGYSVSNMQAKKGLVANELSQLDLKPTIEKFMTLLKDNMEAGLRLEEYLKLKTEELLFLIRSYYTPDELKGFFLPLLSSNVQFHQFVLRYYRKVKTVKEFANLNNCSVSNFDKKFREAFGTSAYQWMQQKKIDLLYHEINATDKPLRQIAKEQKFLSLPQFNDYCKKHFGYPPGKMRKLAFMFREEKSVS
mgnify:CR=1 FL=1